MTEKERMLSETFYISQDEELATDCARSRRLVRLISGTTEEQAEYRVQLFKELFVRTGENLWVGGNTVINSGVTIGDNMIIGSGSAVTKDIPSGVTAAGDPCHVLRPATEEDTRYWEELEREYRRSKGEQGMEHEERKHQRRVWYRGIHPKRYKEKYKELQPGKYPGTVAKVIQKGSTPVGIHIPIMADEILDFLQIQPGQTGLDAALGYGGHTGRMLERLESRGHIYALDADSIKMEKTRKRLENKDYGPEILTIRKLNSANIDQIVRESGPLDFVLADLGVSSIQIDNPSRGFSFRKEGPLDLRLNPLKGEPTSERLKGLTREELTGMLIENSDEPYAEEIARAVMGEIKRGREVATTTRLYEVIDRALAFVPEEKWKEAVKKSCQRIFQVLRTDVDSEFEMLYEFLDKFPGVLRPGGRAAILTFHSGEDRIVRKSFKEIYRAGLYSQTATDVIHPTAEGRRINSCAYSTKMRWAVKA